MNYGAFEYLFGTHHTASTRFVGHNSLFVGLSNILSKLKKSQTLVSSKNDQNLIILIFII